MSIFAQFNDEGFVTAFYNTELFDYDIPADAVEITADQYRDLYGFQGARKWVNGEIVEFTPDPMPVVTIIPAVTLWERMTNVEAEQVAEVMATQPFRTRKIFETAAAFRSDHDLWPLLNQIATQLFGEGRASELLAAESTTPL